MYRDFSKYEIYEDGRIWSKVSNKFLKPQTTRYGYQQVCLIDNNGKRHSQFVHRVCWIAVNGCEVPEGLQINHKDENKCNNNISNLELVTPKENINHGTRNSRVSKAMKGNTNRPPKRVGAFKNGELIMVFASTNEAGRQGFKQGNVCRCCRGKRKTHKGFEWRYLEGEEN